MQIRETQGAGRRTGEEEKAGYKSGILRRRLVKREAKAGGGGEKKRGAQKERERILLRGMWFSKGPFLTYSFWGK